MKTGTTILGAVCCTLLLSLSSNSWANLSTQMDSNITEDDRRSLLASISENAMLPIFKELELASSNLVNQTESFCKLKTETSLVKLRSSWADTAYAWQQADSFLFGPTVDDNIDFGVYFLPIKKGIIKKLLQQDDVLVKGVDRAGVGAQGLGALEYQLFSRENSVSEIRKSFADGSKRCNYLLKTTELLNQNISTITRQWKHYGVQFGLAGNSSLYFLKSQEAMDLWVNKIYQSAEKVSDRKISILSNKQKIKKSTAYKLQAWRSGTSLEQVKANIKGIKRILVDGKVLQWLKDHKKVQVAEDIEQVIELILDQKVAGNDLFKAVQSSPESLQSLIENSHKLSELIQTQLAPSMGVELGFNENDGD